MLSPADKQRLLAKVPLFADLSEAELGEIVPSAQTRTLKKREELFHKGDVATQIFIITRGKLKALTTSGDGDDVVFSILGRGEVLGEVSLLGGTNRTATVTAIDPSQMLVIDRRDFLAYLKSHPEVAINLLELLAQRVTRVSELVEDTLFLNLPLRLAKKLLDLASIYGEETPDGVRVDLKLSQEEWGDLVGATRESINKQVRAWADEGLIRLDKGYFVICKRAELEKLAGAVVI
jgi:CRP/FNR family cyclic AMP-dependent transcriptional regulator